MKGEPDECWLWTDTLNNNGYGYFRKNGKYVLAHREVLSQKLRKPLRALGFACHTCDVRACCNPDHLYEGDAKTNTADMKDRGRSIKGRLIHHDEEVEHAAVELGRAGATCSYIAAELDISAATASKWLKRNGVVVRPKGRPKNIRTAAISEEDLQKLATKLNV